MDAFKIQDLGFEAVRLTTTRGTCRPHMALAFDEHVFAVDTSRTFKNDPVQPDAYLITHAHSDHHGSSAMRSSRAVCSKETARALEIRFGRKYQGRTFKVGETININGVEVATHPTHHTIGSCAFSWVNDNGARVLVTGDVKDASQLPDCDLLVTEANYGDPADPSCYFEDDIAGLDQILTDNLALGAYAFGKAQRAVSLIRNAGWHQEIAMDPKSYQLTKDLMCDCGPLSRILNYDGGHSGIAIVSPWELKKLPGGMKKYVLTSRSDFPYPAIHISDHMDVTGLMGMVLKLKPEATLLYHPNGHRPQRLAVHLNRVGWPAAALSDMFD